MTTGVRYDLPDTINGRNFLALAMQLLSVPMMIGLFIAIGEVTFLSCIVVLPFVGLTLLAALHLRDLQPLLVFPDGLAFTENADHPEFSWNQVTNIQRSHYANTLTRDVYVNIKIQNQKHKISTIISSSNVQQLQALWKANKTS